VKLVLLLLQHQQAARVVLGQRTKLKMMPLAQHVNHGQHVLQVNTRQ